MELCRTPALTFWVCCLAMVVYLDPKYLGFGLLVLVCIAPSESVLFSPSGIVVFLVCLAPSESALLSPSGIAVFSSSEARICESSSELSSSS